MIVYPAIDLRQGKCVRLNQGRFDQATAYADDPVAVARDFAAAGAQWLHVVDLDGAKDGNAAQTDLVLRIARESGLNVQTGGGIRSERQIEAYFADGIARVVIGSLVLTNPGLVALWLDRFGRDRLVLALDVKPANEGTWHVVTHGWQKDSGKTLFDVIDEYGSEYLRHLLCTDVARDGRLSGPNLALYQAISLRYPKLHVQASGGVASLDDLRALKAAGSAGAIIGTALYEGRFTLAEALAC
jgi:phosphoribosylformimino-5-aminoimidazole carboxamide ribotide isomerase